MPPTTSEADTFVNLAREVFSLGFPFTIKRGKVLSIEIVCPNAACFEAALALASERNMDVRGIEGGLLLLPPPNAQPATNFP
jgi:hypothetical protein